MAKGYRCRARRLEERSQRTDIAAHVFEAKEPVTPQKATRKTNHAPIIYCHRPPQNTFENQKKLVEFQSKICADDYLVDQVEFLCQLERTYAIPYDYLSHIITDITVATRSLTVDYLVRLCDQFKFCSETLFLSVNVLDRFLATMGRTTRMPKEKLQSIAVTCVILSAKIHEIHVPAFKELSCNIDEIKRLETLILNSIGFSMIVATAFSFLPIYLHYWRCETRIKIMAEYLCELALLEYEGLAFKPSEIAFSSVHVSKYIEAVHMGMKHDPSSFGSVSTCSRYLLYCAANVNRGGLTAIINKYTTEEKMHVASIVTTVVESI